MVTNLVSHREPQAVLHSVFHIVVVINYDSFSISQQEGIRVALRAKPLYGADFLPQVKLHNSQDINGEIPRAPVSFPKSLSLLSDKGFIQIRCLKILEVKIHY